MLNRYKSSVILALSLGWLLINQFVQAQEWQLLGLETETISAIAIDPFDENTIYTGSSSDFSVGKAGGLFKSTNGGAVWDTLLRGITVRDIDIHPVNSQILYVTGGINSLTSEGIFRTADGGMSWVKVDTNLHLSPEEGPGVLAIDPLHPDTLYLGTGGVFGGTLYKSINGGQTWDQLGENVLSFGISAIAIDPVETSTLFVDGSYFGFIYKTFDGGDSWERLVSFPDVDNVYDLNIHPLSPDTVRWTPYSGRFF